MCLWLPNWPQQRASCKQTARDADGEHALRPAADSAARPDPFADVTALKKLARWCRRYSPIVGLEEADQPEALLLDITGCAHLFGGEAALARQVLRDVARLGLCAQAAIADTIGAAWAAAFCAARKDCRLPLVVPAGQQAVALQPLPVEALRLAPDVVASLRELDLRAIGQLLRLPRETLPARFGPRLLPRLDQALGSVPELIVPECSDEPLEACWECEEPIDNRLAIEAVLRRLLGRVVRGAAARGTGILRLDLALTCAERQPARISIGCIRPTRRCKHLLDLIRLQLERLPLTRGVVGFLMQVTAAAPLHAAPPELFGAGERRDDGRELDSLVNRLSSRLGRSAVLRPELRADHQPERAAAFRPLIGAPNPNPREAKVSFQRSRPARLLPQPVPVAVTALAADGPPTRLRWRNADHQIVHCDGPERIETGWWRQAPIRRDYYRVDTDGGARYWLFRALDDGRWFLHGGF